MTLRPFAFKIHTDFFCSTVRIHLTCPSKLTGSIPISHNEGPERFLCFLQHLVDLNEQTMCKLPKMPFNINFIMRHYT